MLTTIRSEKEELETQFKSLQSYWKKEENEYKKTIEKLEVEQELRGKDKNELIDKVHEQRDTINELKSRIDEMRQEFEDTKAAHRQEIKNLEQKNHENWVSVYNSRKAVVLTVK